MPKLARTVVSAAFSLVIAMAAIGVQPQTAAAADLSISRAELHAVRLLNAERAKAGLVAVRVDSRLMSIARQRSADMASRHYFSHVSPSGQSVFDMIHASGISWYAAGEIIAWNTWPGLADSAVAAKDGWMGSPSHRDIVMSTDYNYVGLGLAIDSSDGKKIWTGVFMKGPDRTGGYVRLAPLPKTTLSSAEAYKVITVSWTGGDIRLQTLTSGLRHYQIQVRTNSGAWNWLSGGTTRTSQDITVWRDPTYDVRIRACDQAGNCGSWARQHVDI